MAKANKDYKRKNPMSATEATKISRDLGISCDMTHKDFDLVPRPKRTIQTKIDKLQLGERLGHLQDLDGNPITRDQIYASLVYNDGNIVKMCKDLRVAHIGKMHELLNDDVELKKLTTFFQNKLINTAQDVILQCLEQKEDRNIQLQAAKFVLKTIGRSVGYGDTPTQINLQVNADEKQKQIMSIFQINQDEDTQQINVTINNQTNTTLEEIENSDDEKPNVIDVVFKTNEEESNKYN